MKKPSVHQHRRFYTLNRFGNSYYSYKGIEQKGVSLDDGYFLLMAKTLSAY